MKTLLTLLFVLFITTTVYSQKKNTINIGANFPIFFPTNLGSGVSRFYPRLGYHVEKSFEINLLNIENLRLNPGFEYFNLHENYSHSRSSNSRYRDIDHKSISLYIKPVKKFDYTNKKSRWYCGAITGIQIFSTSKGEENWIVYTYGNNPSYGGSVIINQKGKSDFFHLFYFGALTGIEWDLSTITWLTPGIELKWFPNFGTVRMYDYKENFGGFELTLNLGFKTRFSKNGYVL